MTHKSTITYFRNNIFEAKSAYTAWKVIAYSKSKNIVGEELANRYVDIQKTAGTFFAQVERSFLISWVILLAHPFERRKDSQSLKNIDQNKYNVFINESKNKRILTQLKSVRDKVFAHRAKNLTDKDLKIPGVKFIDKFFERLETFYNDLSYNIDQSRTQFNNVDYLKEDIETLFKNIERGEKIRLHEINIEWDWAKNNKRISKQI